MTINSLADLIQNEETKNFAGEIIYEKTINVDSDGYKCIDLGNVQGISELTVNGELIGTRWYGAHTYEIGENSISVKLTTIIGNYMKSLEDNPVAMRWTGRQNYYSMGVMGPVLIF